jgi:hypothetical protein
VKRFRASIRDSMVAHGLPAAVRSESPAILDSCPVL